MNQAQCGISTPGAEIQTEYNMAASGSAEALRRRSRSISLKLRQQLGNLCTNKKTWSQVNNIWSSLQQIRTLEFMSCHDSSLFLIFVLPSFSSNWWRLTVYKCEVWGVTPAALALASSTAVRSLPVIFDQDVSFNSYIKQISNVAFSNLHNRAKKKIRSCALHQTKKKKKKNTSVCFLLPLGWIIAIPYYQAAPTTL